MKERNFAAESEVDGRYSNVSDRVLGHHLDIGHPMTTANGMLYSHNSTTIGYILDKDGSQCVL